MQPNQQDSNTQSAPPPSSQPNNPGGFTNVPDYLHLDPVLGPQAKKPSKKRFVVFGALLVILLSSIGAIAVVVLTSSGPNDRFNTALENLMQVKYVNRKFDITSKNPDATVSVQAKSDFSNPAKPKTELSYVVDQPGLLVGQPPAKMHQEGNLVIEKDNDFFAQITKAPSGVTSLVPARITSMKSIKLEQWYEVPSPLVLPYDPGSFRFFNSPIGIVGVGNFSQALRSDLLDFMNANKVYTVQTVSSEQLNGVRTSKFTVKISNQLLNQLNKKIADALQIKYDFDATISLASVQKLEFWVDDATNQFVKIHLENTRTGDTSVSQRDINFDYPSGLQIDTPKNPFVIVVPPQPSQ